MKQTRLNEFGETASRIVDLVPPDNATTEFTKIVAIALENAYAKGLLDAQGAVRNCAKIPEALTAIAQLG